MQPLFVWRPNCHTGGLGAFGQLDRLEKIAVEKGTSRSVCGLHFPNARDTGVRLPAETIASRAMGSSLQLQLQSSS